jgi:hypothetical protein
MLIYGFGKLAAQVSGRTNQDLIRAALHATTYIQLRSLLELLPRLAAKKKSEGQLLDLLEDAARSSVEGFFADLRENKIPFPPELRASLDDVFKSGLGAMLKNAALIYDYDTSNWKPPEATDDQGDSASAPAERKKGRRK